MPHQTTFTDYTASRERAIADTVRQLNDRAAATGHTGRVSSKDVLNLMTYSGWRCQCCGHVFTPLKPLAGEHIYPLSAGRQGHNRPSNIRIVCADCQREAAPKTNSDNVTNSQPKTRGQRPTTSAQMRAVA